jgi:outer membrane lipoprotein-sorting protein
MSISSRRIAGALLISVAAGCGRKAQVSSPPAAGGAPAPAQSVSVNDGESLIRAMHARYVGRWYKDIVFNQTTTLVAQGGQNNSQAWYVAIAAPGKQRIDYVNPDLGNGILQRAESTYVFSGGRVARPSTGWSDLLLLTQDVYMQPPEVTISILRSLGYQMSRLRTTSFDGRTAYVVGSTTVADSSSRQFWVERERMLLVRIREKRAEGQYSDIRLGDFIKAGEGWIAKQTYQLQNGMPRLHQQIAGVKTDTQLNPDLFEPKLFGSVKHWSKP